MDPLKIINETEKLLVDFSFPECSVCKSLLPKIKELAAQFENINFLYIDTHSHPAVGGQHLVFAAPTVIYFENGREQNRWSRVFSVAEVEQALQH